MNIKKFNTILSALIALAWTFANMAAEAQTIPVTSQVTGLGTGVAPALTTTTNSTAGSMSTVPGVAAHTYYFAIRTDGKTGSGTQTDPYDGSTWTNLSGNLSGIVYPSRIIFGPGTYPVSGDLNFPSGAYVTGAGIGATIFQKAAGSVTAYDNMVNLGSSGGSAAYLSDVSIDANGSAQGTNANCNCLAIYGVGTIVQRCSFNGYASNGTANENFAVQAWTDNFETIEDCIFPAPSCAGNLTTLLATGSVGSKVLRNYFAPMSGGSGHPTSIHELSPYGMSWTVDSNYFDNPGANVSPIYTDNPGNPSMSAYLVYGDGVMSNNYFVNFAGAAIGIRPGGWPSSLSVAENIIFQNNRVSSNNGGTLFFSDGVCVGFSFIGNIIDSASMSSSAYPIDFTNALSGTSFNASGNQVLNSGASANLAGFKSTTATLTDFTRNTWVANHSLPINEAVAYDTGTSTSITTTVQNLDESGNLTFAGKLQSSDGNFIFDPSPDTLSVSSGLNIGSGQFLVNSDGSFSAADNNFQVNNDGSFSAFDGAMQVDSSGNLIFGNNLESSDNNFTWDPSTYTFSIGGRPIADAANGTYVPQLNPGDLVVSGGAPSAATGITPGTGVATALTQATNTPGGFVTQNGTFITGSRDVNLGFNLLATSTSTQTATLPDATTVGNGAHLTLKNLSTLAWTVASASGNQIRALGSTGSGSVSSVSLGGGSSTEFCCFSNLWYQLY